MIKISIITVCLNSEETIRDTLNSVLSQDYKNIEHIIVDGGSRDKTKAILNRYPNKNKKIYLCKNSGIYKAINYGIKRSKGDFVTILNSDDFYQSKNSIKHVVDQIIKNKSTKIFFGGVAYFKKLDYYNVRRLYTSTNFKSWHMKYGLMPPHPGSFIKKELYQQYSLYNEKFSIASDFEFFLRTIYINKIKFKTLDGIVVRMRLGGISSKNLFSYIRSTMEISESFRINKLKTNIIKIALRFPWKIKQLFFYSGKNVNKNFSVFKTLFDKKNLFKDNFNIINNFNDINSKKNFILSAMNLAFLGYYAANKVYPYKNLYHWVDGVWAEKYTNLKKQPGRNLFKKLIIPKNIKNIMVVGNISDRSKLFLSKKFKINIIHKQLPYASINILRKIKIILKKNTLTLITLPTPKQEQLAFNLTKNNKNYKIICIGASLAIASGEEREVPAILKNFEFLWRLRSDTIRRTIRLLETIFYYIKGKIIQKKYLNTSFKIID